MQVYSVLICISRVRSRRIWSNSTTIVLHTTRCFAIAQHGMVGGLMIHGVEGGRGEGVAVAILRQCFEVGGGAFGVDFLEPGLQFSKHSTRPSGVGTYQIV